MIASLTSGTLKQYDKPLRLWWDYCKINGVQLLHASITQILEFLSGLTDKVNSYATLNTYRSALSLIMNNDLGSDQRIRRLFKGVASLKPHTPKYPYIWDPDQVLKCLSTLYPNETISLENLCFKLVTLLALITAQRVQTLALIKLENSTFLVDSIPDRIKTTRLNRNQPYLKIPFFREQPKLCSASTLQVYISRTKELQSESENRLIITNKKPHKAATSQSISRWIKGALCKSGIVQSGNIFGAQHETCINIGCVPSKG